MPCHTRMKTKLLQGLLWLCLFGYAVMVTALEPGFLDFDNLPDTNFSCVGKVIGGYYADLETSCQMFHVCTIGQLDEPMDIRFLCLNGTVFDQETRVCERIDEVDCTKSEQFYSLNLELYGNTQPPILEESPETEPPIQKPPPATTTTTTTRKPPVTKATRPPYLNTSPPPTTTIRSTSKVISSHHFPVGNSPDIRFNPSEINIRLNPPTPPIIRNKPGSYQQPSFSVSENSKIQVTTRGNSQQKSEERRNVPITTARPKTIINYDVAYTKNIAPATPSDINYEFYRKTEPIVEYHTEQYQYHPTPVRNNMEINYQTSREPVYRTSTYRYHQPTSKRHYLPYKPTTYRSPTAYPSSLRPHYHRTQAAREQLPVLPTLPPLVFSSPAPFTLERHKEAKRYTNETPRIIISASASVSDASGNRLNYSLGSFDPSIILEEAPSSYDEYKESDVGLDPFYHDVPKIKSGRSKRSADGLKHSDIIKNEQEAVDVLKFLFEWYTNHEKTSTASVPVTPEIITEINQELGSTNVEINDIDDSFVTSTVFEENSPHDHFQVQNIQDYVQQIIPSTETISETTERSNIFVSNNQDDGLNKQTTTEEIVTDYPSTKAGTTNNREDIARELRKEETLKNISSLLLDYVDDNYEPQTYHDPIFPLTEEGSHFDEAMQSELQKYQTAANPVTEVGTKVSVGEVRIEEKVVRNNKSKRRRGRGRKRHRTSGNGKHNGTVPNTVERPPKKGKSSKAFNLVPHSTDKSPIQSIVTEINVHQSDTTQLSTERMVESKSRTIGEKILNAQEKSQQSEENDNTQISTSKTPTDEIDSTTEDSLQYSTATSSTELPTHRTVLNGDDEFKTAIEVPQESTRSEVNIEENGEPTITATEFNSKIEERTNADSTTRSSTELPIFPEVLTVTSTEEELEPFFDVKQLSTTSTASSVNNIFDHTQQSKEPLSTQQDFGSDEDNYEEIGATSPYTKKLISTTVKLVTLPTHVPPTEGVLKAKSEQSSTKEFELREDSTENFSPYSVQSGSTSESLVNVQATKNNASDQTNRRRRPLSTETPTEAVSSTASSIDNILYNDQQSNEQSSTKKVELYENRTEELSPFTVTSENLLDGYAITKNVRDQSNRRRRPLSTEVPPTTVVTSTLSSVGDKDKDPQQIVELPATQNFELDKDAVEESSPRVVQLSSTETTNKVNHKTLRRRRPVAPSTTSPVNYISKSLQQTDEPPPSQNNTEESSPRIVQLSSTSENLMNNYATTSNISFQANRRRRPIAIEVQSTKAVSSTASSVYNISDNPQQTTDPQSTQDVDLTDESIPNDTVELSSTTEKLIDNYGTGNHVQYQKSRRRRPSYTRVPPTKAVPSIEPLLEEPEQSALSEINTEETSHYDPVNHYNNKHIDSSTEEHPQSTFSSSTEEQIVPQSEPTEIESLLIVPEDIETKGNTEREHAQIEQEIITDSPKSQSTTLLEFLTSSYYPKFKEGSSEPVLLQINNLELKTTEDNNLFANTKQHQIEEVTHQRRRPHIERSSTIEPTSSTTESSDRNYRRRGRIRTSLKFDVNGDSVQHKEVLMDVVKEESKTEVPLRVTGYYIPVVRTQPTTQRRRSKSRFKPSSEYDEKIKENLSVKEAERRNDGIEISDNKENKISNVEKNEELIVTNESNSLIKEDFDVGTDGIYSNEEKTTEHETNYTTEMGNVTTQEVPQHETATDFSEALKNFAKYFTVSTGDYKTSAGTTVLPTTEFQTTAPSTTDQKTTTEFSEATVLPSESTTSNMPSLYEQLEEFITNIESSTKSVMVSNLSPSNTVIHGTDHTTESNGILKESLELYRKLYYGESIEESGSTTEKSSTTTTEKLSTARSSRGRHRFGPDRNKVVPIEEQSIFNSEHELVDTAQSIKTASLNKLEAPKGLEKPEGSFFIETTTTTEVPSTDASLAKSANPTQSKVREELPTTPINKFRRVKIRKEQLNKNFIFNCFGKKLNQFYSDPRDCRLFHYCTPGFTKNQLLDMKFVCDSGTYFDDEKLICTNAVPTRCL